MKPSRHPPGLVVHVFAQCCYVAVSLRHFSLQRPLTWWALQLAAVVAYYGLARGRRGNPAWPWVAVAIGNSVYLNLEGHALWTYLLAGFIGVTALRAFVDEAGRHPFNPSAFGALAVILLFPSWATAPAWTQDLRLSALVLVLGGVVGLLNRRWAVACSYLLGFALTSVAYWAVLPLLGLADSVHRHSVWFWPSVLCGPGTLIFAFHVITDPATSPRDARAQAVFGFSIGALDLLLRAAGRVLLADFIAYNVVLLAYWLLTSRTAPAGASPSVRSAGV